MDQKEIIITTPEIYAKKLKEILIGENFKVYNFPTIETLFYDNPSIKSYFNGIKTYDCIILPSKQAIISYFKYIEKYKIDKSDIVKLKYAGIGQDIEFLKSFGISTILKIEEASTYGIFQALKRQNNINKLLVFTPKVKKITEPDIIPNFISQLKTLAKVDRADAYITQAVLNTDKTILQKIIHNNYDLIALTSGGEIEALKYLLRDKTLFLNLKLACFGPYTASTALKSGIQPCVTGKNFNSFKDFSITLTRYFKALNRQ